MNAQTKSNLSDFAKKALQRIQDRKKPRYRFLEIPSLGQTIKIRNLWDDEITECTELSDDNDTLRGDKYAVYLAVADPDLRAVATELKEAGEIAEYTEVVNIFAVSEIRDISVEIMKLSGWIGDNDKRVQVVEVAATKLVDALKN